MALRVVEYKRGAPHEGVRFQDEVELREPGQGEVLVRMELAPINPSDINVMEGVYPVLPPTLPGALGFEGTGTVAKVGSGVAFAVNDRVFVAFGGGLGTFSRFALLPASALRRVPDGVDAHTACMLAVNPPSAYAMVRDTVRLERGEWLIQNAANSGIGACIVHVAKHLGLKTVNIVRRPELVESVRAVGGDVVLVYPPAEGQPPLKQQVAEATGKAKIRLALNAVGGACATECAKCLAEDGKLVTYGAMSREPITIPNGLLIFKRIAFVGFHLSGWLREASQQDVDEMWRVLAELAVQGKLRVPVQCVVPLSKGAEAVAEAFKDGRNGKVLLSCQE